MFAGVFVLEVYKIVLGLCGGFDGNRGLLQQHPEGAPSLFDRLNCQKSATCCH